MDYPWNAKDAFDDLVYDSVENCENPSTCQGVPTRGYDPRKRAWYVGAIRGDPSDVFFTSPYVDALSGNTLISASKQLIGSAGLAVGVVGADIEMETLASFILGGSVLESGFSFLMTDSSQVIVYPELERDRVYLLPEVLFDSDKERSDFDSTLDEVLSRPKLSAFQVNYTRQGETWVLTSFAFDSFIVANTVPWKEVIQPAVEAEKKIKDAIIVAACVSAGFLVLIGFIAALVNRKVARIVTKPILELDRATRAVASDELDVELDAVNPDAQEMADVCDSFQKLILTIRFAHRSFFEGHPNQALENYRQVEQLMLNLDNRRGLAVVWNNIAMTLRELDRDLERAIELELQAIEVSREAAEEDEESLRSIHEAAMGNRYGNLGLLYQSAASPDLAQEAFEASIKIHRKLNNDLGEVRVIGNLGMMLLESDQQAKALDMLEECAQRASYGFASNPSEKTAELLRYAVFNKAQYFMARGDYPGAVQNLTYCLTIGKTIDPRFMEQCKHSLFVCYTELGDKTKALQTEFSPARSGPKHVVFVLDCSGSMAGSLIDQCKQSILMIVDEYCASHDTSTLIAFNSHVDVLYERGQTDDQGVRRMRKVVNDVRTRGRTAFYDAINAALNLTQNETETAWIIALTDGADNASEKSHEFIAQMFHQRHTNFILITVGEATRNQKLLSLPNEADKGLLLKADNAEQVGEAFEKVASVISKGHVNIETL